MEAEPEQENEKRGRSHINGRHEGQELLTRNISSVGAASFFRLSMMAMMAEVGSLLETALPSALIRRESSRSSMVDIVIWSGS